MQKEMQVRNSSSSKFILGMSALFFQIDKLDAAKHKALLAVKRTIICDQFEDVRSNAAEMAHSTIEMINRIAQSDIKPPIIIIDPTKKSQSSGYYLHASPDHIFVNPHIPPEELFVTVAHETVHYARNKLGNSAQTSTRALNFVLLNVEEGVAEFISEYLTAKSSRFKEGALLRHGIHQYDSLESSLLLYDAIADDLKSGSAIMRNMRDFMDSEVEISGLDAVYALGSAVVNIIFAANDFNAEATVSELLRSTNINLFARIVELVNGDSGDMLKTKLSSICKLIDDLNSRIDRYFDKHAVAIALKAASEAAVIASAKRA